MGKLIRLELYSKISRSIMSTSLTNRRKTSNPTRATMFYYLVIHISRPSLDPMAQANPIRAFSLSVNRTFAKFLEWMPFPLYLELNHLICDLRI